MRCTAIGQSAGLLLVALLAVACGGNSDSGAGPSGSGAGNTSAGSNASGASGSGASNGGASSGQSGASANGGSGAGQAGGTATSGTSAMLGGCAMFPANHIFNTPIDTLPVDAGSKAFLDTIGAHKIHLDLGTSVDQKAADYYGIPYNVVHSKVLPWVNVTFSSSDGTADEGDCAVGDAHTFTSPCIGAAAAKPQFPIPAAPLVEGGIETDPSKYGDHHVLLLDSDTCSLWELYHVYPDAKGGWDILGSAYFDLHSNALRKAGWTSADAAGFPILPLLLRADEASSGTITHALRFTIESDTIRQEYIWPARHLTTNGTMSMSQPPMGQAFRIKSSYTIPANFNSQSRAILQALKTYGMYLADGGSAFYIQGEPSANWQDDTFSQVQSVASDQFEAVDLTSISKRAGFDPNSATVP
ncbi:MAG TPA: hypothetical protein VGF76_05590, partial [Polyangiaceae bacterium]